MDADTSPDILHRRLTVTGEDLVEPGQLGLVELHVEGPQRALELLHRARTDDRSGHRRLVQQPGDPDVRRRGTPLAAGVLVGLQRGPVPLDALAVALLVAAVAGLVAEHAGQQALRERAPRDDPDAVVLSGGQYLELHVPREQVVVRLLADQAQEVPAGGRLVRRGELPGGVVGGADVEDLALRDQRLAGLPDLVPRRGRVDVVELVEVDPVGLHPAQRGLARPDQVPGGEERVVGPVAHRAVDLGGQHRLLAALAAAGEPAAEHLLGAPLARVEAVDVRGVEEVDALGQCPVHDRVGVELLGLPPEVHRAEAQAGDRQAAASQVRVLHGRQPGRLPGVPQTPGTPSAFDAATAVRRAEGGGLVADLDPGWDVGGGVLNGGYLLAVAARAAVLDSPHPHPVALSASYLRATAGG